MARNFGKSGASKVFSEVARTSATMGNMESILVLPDSVLLDYPDNIAVGDTADLEASMAQVGFTTPLEVTAFGQDEGYYMIVSGHRRRVAGKNQGMTAFKCIVRGFSSRDEVDNYVLFANNQRDSAKDPFLQAALYAKHEQYLSNTGFKGDKTSEIAARMGMSKAQAGRYAAFGKCAKAFQTMYADELVGMSSLAPVAAHPEAEQEEMLPMFMECLDAGLGLTRERVKSIVDGYRNGKRTLSEITADETAQGDTKRPPQDDSAIPLDATRDTETSQPPGGSETDTDVAGRETIHDPITAEANMAAEVQPLSEVASPTSVEFDITEVATIQASDVEEASDEVAQIQAERGQRIIWLAYELDRFLKRDRSEPYSFEDKAEALTAMNQMGNTCKAMLNALQEMKSEYELIEDYTRTMRLIRDELALSSSGRFVIQEKYPSDKKWTTLPTRYNTLDEAKNALPKAGARIGVFRIAEESRIQRYQPVKFEL